MVKELLFSVTAKDCEWAYTRGSGPGGQKKNKTSSAVHCTHIASGAAGYSETSRSQAENKQLAFKRMSETPRFQTWLRTETCKRTGMEKKIEEQVEYELKHNIQVDVKDNNGRWVKEESMVAIV